MSRLYEMSVTISGYKPGKEAAIKYAAESEWEMEDWYEFPLEDLKDKDKSLSASGRSNLCGGETESDFARRLAKAVFEANGGPCTVEVVDEDNLPD